MLPKPNEDPYSHLFLRLFTNTRPPPPHQSYTRHLNLRRHLKILYQTIGPPLPAELTTGFRLLGSPVGYPAFAREYLNTQLIDIQTCITTMSIAITDQHTKLRLFSQCLIQKIPHLLGCDVLYQHYDTDEPPPDWTDWNGPLTLATNHINARFISDTIGVTTLSHHALLIAQLSLYAGRLGILDPRTSAIPDFMLTLTTSTQHAANRIYLNKHLNNVHIHPTIAALYSTNTNPHSLILKRFHFHHILPNIVTSSCPPTIPRTDLAHYFFTTLSPHSACGRLKKHSTGIVTGADMSTGALFHDEMSETTSFGVSLLKYQSKCSPNNGV
jgi:hypothetical protein